MAKYTAHDIERVAKLTKEGLSSKQQARLLNLRPNQVDYLRRLAALSKTIDRPTTPADIQYIRETTLAGQSALTQALALGLPLRKVTYQRTLLRHEGIRSPTSDKLTEVVRLRISFKDLLRLKALALRNKITLTEQARQIVHNYLAEKEP